MEKLTSVGSKIQGSGYARKVHRREIHGLMVYFGMPVFWISICPTDIHSPILLVLAGEEIDYDILGNLDKFSSLSKRAEIAAKDPVAASLYFNLVIDAFIEFLLGYGKESGGLLGHVSTYSGAVEEQGRGTLHIHMLVWLQGYTSRSGLESRFQDDEFKKKLLQYLEDTIHEAFLDPDADHNNLNVSEVSFARPINPVDPEFDSKFSNDVDRLVTVANTHCHTFTCYKYGKSGDCRFGFPRDLISQSTVSVEGEIKLRRTHCDVNNFNPFIMECLRSNHDIKFVASGKDGKACAFYMTDYATKTSLPTHQMFPLMAATLKNLDASPALNTNSIDKSKQIIVKLLNRITTEQELSGAHVCNFLLGFSDKKCPHLFSNLNVHSCLAWVADNETEFTDKSNALGDEDGPEAASLMVAEGKPRTCVG